MMFAALLLALQAAAPVPPAPPLTSPQAQLPAARELAAALNRLRFRAGVNREGETPRCRITRSSGNKAIDDAACDAVHLCTAAAPDPTPEAINACVRRDLVSRAAKIVVTQDAGRR